MKVAFTPFVDLAWTGGLHYLRNLFSALAEVPGRPLEPVLFIGPESPAAGWKPLEPFLQRPPVLVPSWRGRRGLRLLRATLTQRDRASEAAFAAAGVDLVFENDVWFGARMGLPTLAWIADFQHHHLPQMFTPWQRFLRTSKYRAYCTHASGVMVSSQDGRADCERYYPVARGRVDAVPFAVQVPAQALAADARAVAARHGLAGRFFFFPGQMWRHKNHLRLVQALAALKAAGTPVVVAASGHAADAFRPGYPSEVARAVQDAALGDSLRFLGHLPYADIMPLMRASAAVLNPSLFEGWSTTVEEAKATGVPLVLSGLAVHREQAPAGTAFFDPASADDIARVLLDAWRSLPAGPRPPAAEQAAFDAYAARRAEFEQRFIDVAQQAVARHRRQCGAAPGRAAAGQPR